MLPIVAAAIGGSIVAAGTQVYNKWKALRAPDPNAARIPEVTLASELEPLKQALNRQREKLTVVISRSTSSLGQQVHVAKEEVQFFASVVFEETQHTLHHINEAEIKPMRAAMRDELHALGTVIDEDDGILADSARTIRDAVRGARN